MAVANLSVKIIASDRTFICSLSNKKFSNATVRCVNNCILSYHFINYFIYNLEVIHYILKTVNYFTLQKSRKETEPFDYFDSEVM